MDGRACPLCGAALPEGPWLAVLEAHFAVCAATEPFAPPAEERRP